MRDHQWQRNEICEGQRPRRVGAAQIAWLHLLIMLPSALSSALDELVAQQGLSLGDARPRAVLELLVFGPTRQPCG